MILSTVEERFGTDGVVLFGRVVIVGGLKGKYFLKDRTEHVVGDMVVLDLLAYMAPLLNTDSEPQLGQEDPFELRGELGSAKGLGPIPVYVLQFLFGIFGAVLAKIKG